jgi:hypothetical protein
MQVYVFPLAVAVVPAFLQVSPAFTAAIAFNGAIRIARVVKISTNFFMILETP